jgi:hypothetical protein
MGAELLISGASFISNGTIDNSDTEIDSQAEPHSNDLLSQSCRTLTLK